MASSYLGRVAIILAVSCKLLLSFYWWECSLLIKDLKTPALEFPLELSLFRFKIYPRALFLPLAMSFFGCLLDNIMLINIWEWKY